MRCIVLHESKGRLRVRLCQGRMTLEQADMVEYFFRSKSFVRRVKVFDRTCDAVIEYTGDRARVTSALASFSYNDEVRQLVPEHTGRALDREFEDKLIFMIAKRYIGKLILPVSIRYAGAVIKSLKYVWEAVKCIAKGRIEVSILDATAIVVSLIRGDRATASSVMFLLKIGELLEEWTHKRSVDDLAGTLSLGVEKVWLTGGESDILVPVRSVKAGDSIIVRTGGMIPLDGKVISGEAEVNQSSMTGESMPVRKKEGSYVYAGTVVEDGAIVICVDKTAGSGRYDRIVKMIENSEKLKSEAESKAAHLADKLVPYSLGGTVITYLLTRNAQRALSFLMVDFSCALKLAMPISVISAMRECGLRGITVKGGKFLEAVAEADTIVFDKTGTLTHAEPKVSGMVTFGGNDETECLRLAACLEEHFPHSIANAVVNEAAARGITHEEKHSAVQYVVAHGISSTIDGEKCIIGSYHFVFEDEGTVIPEGEEHKLNELPEECSRLYLAVGGRLAAVLCIEDPLRDEAAEVISALHDLGITKTVMMTGDGKHAARSAAQRSGVDEYYSEVLPEDKAAYIRREHELGRKVIMIGDGVNDSPALSEADAGIAINTGAAIAREIADIMINADDLRSLIVLRRISEELMKRIHSNYRTIIGFNFSLILLGALGLLPPATSAFLHNTSTIVIGTASMRNYLKEE